MKRWTALSALTLTVGLASGLAAWANDDTTAPDRDTDMVTYERNLYLHRNGDQISRFHRHRAGQRDDGTLGQDMLSQERDHFANRDAEEESMDDRAEMRRRYHEQTNQSAGTASRDENRAADRAEAETAPVGSLSDDDFDDAGSYRSSQEAGRMDQADASARADQTRSDAMNAKAGKASTTSASDASAAGAAATSGAAAGADRQRQARATPSEDMSPKDVCRSLVAAVRANDLQAVRTHVAGGKVEGNAGLDWMRNASCEGEHVAGNNAFVESELNTRTKVSEATTHYLPFVRDEGVWKFDLRSYRTFYRSTSSG